MNYFIGALVCFVLFAHTTAVFAKEPVPSPTPVDYTLPYPGLMPGHPFSFLKEARDVIIGFFTSQPMDKAEFNLLQADKNLQASYLLATKASGKSSVVASALTKAEDYFGESIDQMMEAKAQGIDTREFTKVLWIANKKHQEIIAQILVSARKTDKQIIQKEQKRAQQFGKEIQSMLRK